IDQVRADVFLGLLDGGMSGLDDDQIIAVLFDNAARKRAGDEDDYDDQLSDDPFDDSGIDDSTDLYDTCDDTDDTNGDGENTRLSEGLHDVQHTNGDKNGDKNGEMDGDKDGDVDDTVTGESPSGSADHGDVTDPCNSSGDPGDTDPDTGCSGSAHGDGPNDGGPTGPVSGTGPGPAGPADRTGASAGSVSGVWGGNLGANANANANVSVSPSPSPSPSPSVSLAGRVGGSRDDSADLKNGSADTAAGAARSVGFAAGELRVQVSTLMHLDDLPAELAGWGPIHAQLARRLAKRQIGGEWRFAICDEDGQLLHAGITRRRPAGWPRQPAPGPAPDPAPGPVHGRGFTPGLPSQPLAGDNRDGSDPAGTARVGVTPARTPAAGQEDGDRPGGALHARPASVRRRGIVEL
ncbi:hypothetical protein IMZ11_42180, partial [Microtetraspora sp. AC03309]|nr:hypothetical protein [Microtetraspora sp. AC03309]